MDNNFTQSFDAQDWARAFVEHVKANPEIATDEGTMIGWFANAIMRGYDEHARRSPTPEGRFAAYSALNTTVAEARAKEQR